MNEKLLNFINLLKFSGVFKIAYWIKILVDNSNINNILRPQILSKFILKIRIHNNINNHCPFSNIMFPELSHAV